MLNESAPACSHLIFSFKVFTPLMLLFKTVICALHFIYIKFHIYGVIGSKVGVSGSECSTRLCLFKNGLRMMLILVIEELFTKLNPLLLPENQVGILFSNTSLASSFLPHLSNVFSIKTKVRRH